MYKSEASILRELEEKDGILLSKNQRDHRYPFAIMLSVVRYLTIIEDLVTPSHQHRKYLKQYAKINFDDLSAFQEIDGSLDELKKFSIWDVSRDQDDILRKLDEDDAVILAKGQKDDSDPVAVVLRIDKYRSIMAYIKTTDDQHRKHLQLYAEIENGDYSSFHDEIVNGCYLR